MPATHQIQPATSLGQQLGDNAYFSSVVDHPTAAFQFIDSVNVNHTLVDYPTAAALPHAIVNQQPSQMIHQLDAYQQRVEIPEQLFLNRPPMVPLEVAGPPALNYGVYEGCSPESTQPHSAANGKAVDIRERSTGGKI
ncbi:hypothetical protein CBS63078_4210 [Aspergillus niger]|nr:hypothetical protein CBS63078_4210 [Aspergillus niger]KAI2968557.1 hypothetical protein CBS147323_4342 [Aspergillus niger]KAI3028503.1 hypothetical protein CBS147347_3757 [Aspergillus niger]